MWTARSEELAGVRGMRSTLDVDARPATVAEVIRGWLVDADFRSFFNAVLAGSPYSAFRWETPAITTSTVAMPFEFILLDNPGLAREPDPDAFAEHFTDEPVVVFQNLGGDATMIVPCPVSNASAYGHLAAFVRLAPEGQQHALWKTVGEELTRRLFDEPIWLSTAGAGVSWLHVRIDDRPKYYGYGPYKSV